VSDDYPPDDVDLVGQFALELTQPEDMGFMDRGQNLIAMCESGDNMEQAVERLLKKSNPDEGP
jgi:hypothetical protein